jgi:hypothetical protein
MGPLILERFFCLGNHAHFRNCVNSGRQEREIVIVPRSSAWPVRRLFIGSINRYPESWNTGPKAMSDEIIKQGPGFVIYRVSDSGPRSLP